MPQDAAGRSAVIQPAMPFGGHKCPPEHTLLVRAKGLTPGGGTAKQSELWPCRQPPLSLAVAPGSFAHWGMSFHPCASISSFLNWDEDLTLPPLYSYYEDFRIYLGKAANFSPQFYGPVAGALAGRDIASWGGDLRSVSFDLTSKRG